ncbi:MAG: hypothetical protein AB7G62_01435 [Magnetospirillum sp.]
MKARSVIFTQQQHQPTIFGFPPILSLLSAGAGTFVYVGCVATGLTSVALIISTLITVLGLIKAHRLGKADRHVESVFLTTLKFWGFNSTCRGLTTGAPPERSHQGGRS